MLDNDNLTYSPKRPGSFGVNRTSERILLTPDRSQKLDLLIHLLTNLQQSLIVCGPEGIGKTTLFQALINSHQDVWPICLLPGSPALSFESVMTRLSQFLNLSSANLRFDMSSLRAFCAKQKVVLAIDDAGELVPGLIGELIDFADSLPGLRLVFAMNSDEFQTKSSSDKALDACHLIELPPLNQRQCLEYLQNLSAQPGTQLSFKAVTDELAEELFRQTQGIPGKLLAELPKVEYYQGKQRKLGLWLGVLVIVAAAGFAAYTLLPPMVFEDNVADAPAEAEPASSEPTPIASVEKITEQITKAPTVDTHSMTPANALIPEHLPSEHLPTAPETPPTIEITPTATAASIPAPSPDPVPPAAPVEAKLPAIPEPAPSVPAVEPAAEPPRPAENPTVETPVATAKTTEKPTAGKTGTDGGDLDWIMSQPASNYTVQIMVLSNKQGVSRFLKKYAEYRDSLKYYSIGKEGQERYVLIYGSFPSSIDALNNKSDMPNEFNQGLVKRFNVIQKESRRKQ